MKNKLYKILKNNILNKKFLIFLLVTLVFYGALYKLSYTRCTYRMYGNDWILEFDKIIGNGRFITAFLWAFVSNIKVDIHITYFISYVLAIFFVALASYKLNEILKEYIYNSKISLIISILIIFNAGLIDYFVYLEKGVMAFSLFSAVMAIKYFERYLKNNEVRNLFLALTYMILVSFSYQASGAIFLLIALVLILKNTNNFKKFLKNTIIAVAIFVLPLILNYFIVQILSENTRISDNLSIIESSQVILKQLILTLINSGGTLPQYVFIFVLVSIVLIYIASIVKTIIENKDLRKRQLKLLLELMCILILGILLAIIPQYGLETKYINLSPRATIVLYTLIGTLILHMNNEVELKPIVQKIIVIILIGYIVIEWVSVQKIIYGMYKVNELDISAAKSIVSKIHEYEENNNIKVKYFVYYFDKNPTNSYPNIKNYKELNEKIISAPWKNVSLITLYSNGKIKLKPSTEYIDKNLEHQFKEKDWDYYDNEQLVFRGDTMHWCLF